MSEFHDWQTCDGSGRIVRNDQRAAMGLSRRGLMAGVGAGVLGWLAARPAIAQLTIDPSRKGQNVLVSVFLRGGADALALVPPLFEDLYYQLRPTLAITERTALRLDGKFGLHPKLAGLHGLYEKGQLAVIHAVGSEDSTRSHFEAMDTMERGAADREGPSSGWIARYLRATEHPTDNPLRAVAFSSTMPASLVGATSAIALNNLADFQLQAPEGAKDLLRKLYGSPKDAVSHAGKETLSVLDSVAQLDAANYKASHGAAYPESDLGNALKQVALLVKNDIGLEVACLDKGGWDTHVAQGTPTVGWLAGLLDDLDRSLAAFALDLGTHLNRVTVVVQSEFGRRIEENRGLGTDHGHGGAMFVFGGGVKGGRVIVDWPSLAKRVGPGDLATTTDYRDCLGEIVQKRMRPAELETLFNGHQVKPVGLLG